MPLSTAQSSRFTAEDNNHIERQVAADTKGLSLTEVETMESRAYTQYTEPSKKDGENSRAATAALIRWALIGQHLDSMESGFQHVSSIPLIAGSALGGS